MIPLQPIVRDISLTVFRLHVCNRDAGSAYIYSAELAELRHARGYFNLNVIDSADGYYFCSDNIVRIAGNIYASYRHTALSRFNYLFCTYYPFTGR